MIKADETSPKQLRDYGLLMGAAVAVLFSLYPWLILKKSFVLWPWAIVAIFWSLSVLSPNALRPLYVLWMKIGNILGKINSTILLTLCFFVLFVPVSVFFKLAKRDRLERFSFLNKKSFRHIRSISREPKQMEYPF